MKYTLAFVLALALAGCDDKPKAEDITYYQDTRTDLCFSVYYPPFGDRGFFVNVPCTDKLKSYLNQKTSGKLID